MLPTDLTPEVHHLCTRLKSGQWDPGKDFLGGRVEGEKRTQTYIYIYIYIGKKLIVFFVLFFEFSKGA